MWHEARKQERKIRGMLVDYRRRAERRRDFYEKIVSFYIVLTLSSVLIGNTLIVSICFVESRSNTIYATPWTLI